MAVTATFDCDPDETPCRHCTPGHAIHWIQAKLVGKTPWGWRDGTVAAKDGKWITVAYLDGGTARCWHHQDLGDEITVGMPVRLHEQFGVMTILSGMICVNCVEGLGAVPEPADPALWAAQMSPGIVDLDRDRGIIGHDGGSPPADDA